MWTEACALIERAERLHRQFFRLGLSPARQPTWEPPIDMFESERELQILIALPGVEPARIEIMMDSGVLIVAGERPVPEGLRGAAIHRMEIPYGRFERRIELPRGQFELNGQELSYGCLMLAFTKL
jgi:HSP20 family molecular chaperone IbpA